MATNDLILLDKIIEENATNLKKPNDGDFFERFCNEQILKNYDLSAEELESGITDGADDGGIDSIYIFVNGCLLTDLDILNTQKRDSSIEMLVITSKHADSFEQAVINSEYTTFVEFYDLALTNDQLVSPLNDRVLEKRKLFIDTYLKLATKLQSFQIKYIYVSRGDSQNFGDNIKSKSVQLIDLTKKFFSGCEATYNFLGASDILELYRKKKEFNIDLPFCEQLSADSQKYIILCNLKEFYKFLKDDNGELKRYLFDSNVRDYNGLNKTNSDILDTLENKKNVDFWWLNNGITILSSNAVNMGKFIRIENVQIVNGLQTSYTLFDYFSKTSDLEDNRKLMVKIITETDPSVRDMVIRATNSQTAISEASLHATDKIQRDIEDILLKYELCYERRTNYYVNQGYDESKIFTPLYLAKGYVALIQKNIREGIILKQKVMQSQSKYKSIFIDCPLGYWPIIAKILRASDTLIIKKKTSSEGYRKILRHLIAFLSLSLYFKKFDYTHKDLNKLSFSDVDKFQFEFVYNFIIQNSCSFDKAIWKSYQFINNLIKIASIKLSINNPKSVIVKQNKKLSYTPKRKKSISNDQEIELIKNELPAQPWSQNIHIDIATKLNKKPSQVYNIISFLIERGEYYVQIDGTLYDKEGNIVD